MAIAGLKKGCKGSGWLPFYKHSPMMLDLSLYAYITKVTPIGRTIGLDFTYRNILTIAYRLEQAYKKKESLKD